MTINTVYFSDILYKCQLFIIRHWQCPFYELQHPYLDSDISIVEYMAQFVSGENQCKLQKYSWYIDDLFL